MPAPEKNEIEIETETETETTAEPAVEIELSAAEELKKMAEENKNILFKAQEKESDPTIFEPTPIKGAIKCPYCDAETSASFDFCLYCSKSLKGE